MKLRILLLAILALSFSVQEIHAQFGVSVNNGNVTLTGFGEVDLEKTVEFWSASHRDLINQKMELLIVQVDDVCGLTDKETQKLKLSVKGIVSRRIAAGQEQVELFAQKSGLVEPEGDLQEKEYPKHDRLTIYSASPQEEGVIQFSSFFGTSLTDHPLWDKALESSLSPEQLELYERHRIGLNRKFLHAAIDLWVAEINAQVFLTPSQVEAVTASLRENLNPSVTTSFPVSFKNAKIFVEERYSSQADSLGELLNEKQTQRRKVLLEAPRGRVGWGAGPDR